MRADLFLLPVALVWGSAFVAQRLGMERFGPLAFNTSRFTVGGLAPIPTLGRRRLRSLSRRELRGVCCRASLPFVAASLQQFGLV